MWALLLGCLAVPGSARLQAATRGPDGLREEVLQAAIARTRCAVRRGEMQAPRTLAVIDFDLPSTARRLWLLDLARGELLLHTWVSHGSGNGEDLAVRFSNVQDSHQSSLGLYRGAEPYVGRHGRSLRLDGLDPGFNDAARQRDIVIHGADYARPDHIEQWGRLGRSQGCPAVSPEDAPLLIDSLAEGGALFVWSSRADFRAHLDRHCDGGGRAR